VSEQTAKAPTAPAWSLAHRILAGVAGLGVVVILWISSDLILAAPIGAVTEVAGSWFAFVLFSAVYSIASFLLALLALRAYERFSKGESSRLAMWLDRQASSPRARWARPLAQGGRVVGFVVGSVAVGGVLMTWFLRYSGRREGLVGAAALSSTIFGITFTATYAGIFHFLL
jgi:hypothetical protein